MFLFGNWPQTRRRASVAVTVLILTVSFGFTNRQLGAQLINLVVSGFRAVALQRAPLLMTIDVGRLSPAICGESSTAKAVCAKSAISSR
jgi:hypothetical protein